jgi:predicted lipoprotein
LNVSRELESFQRLLAGPVAGKLGLVVGFNSLDGD